MAGQFRENWKRLTGIRATAPDSTSDIVRLGDITADVNSVKSFGATGDGVTDDISSLQLAINSRSGQTLLLPSGIYLIGSPLNLSNGVKLVGDGKHSIIKPTNTGWGVSESGNAMLNLVDVTGVIVRDLTIDQDGANRTASNYVFFSMMLNGAQDCTVDNVSFINNGRSFDSPTGPALLLVSKDQDGDWPEGQNLATKNNTIQNCEFLKPDSLNLAFAIRAVTNWELKRDFNQFVNRTENNVFDNCKFDGEFFWNHLEIAGGGTSFNRVSNCHFTGRTLSAIDFDKGASSNIAIGNTIASGGRSSEFVGNSTVRVAAIFDHGTDLGYVNRRNIIANNIIENIVNPVATDQLESAISVGWASGSIVRGNQIFNVNNSSGVGILIERDSDNVTIDGNIMSAINQGVGNNVNGSRYRNLTISNNQILSTSQSVVLGGVAENSGLVINGNSFQTQLSSQIGVNIGSSWTDVVISNNRIVGGFENINLNSPQSVLVGNICKDASSRGIRLNSHAILIGNAVFSSTLDDVIVASGTKEPTFVGNYFPNTNAKEGPTITYGSAAPTEGTWRLGDIVYNTSVSAGGFIGWTCTTAGTPGTWKEFGAIQA